MESITIVADTDIHIVSVGAQGPAGPAGPPGAAVNIDDTTPSTSTTFSSEHILGLIPEVSLSGEATAVAGVVTLSNDAVTGKVLTGFTSGAGVVAPTDSILQAIEKLDGNNAGKANAAEKDAFGGHAGLTAFRLNLKNATGTVLSWLTSTATAARIWTMPDKDGTVAMLSDLAGAETAATIKTKLGITTLSGDNTGDQVIPTTLPASDVSAWAKAATKPAYTAAEVGAQVAGTYAAGTGTANGTNTGDETGATIRSKLGVTTLSGSNTGDQVIPTTLPASDVSAWAKAAVKPTYTAAEVGAQAAGAYASGTGSATNANTGDNAVNALYAGLVSNATHNGDATGSTGLTVVGINGTNLAGLGSGVLKLTAGMPHLAVNSDLPAMSATVGGAVPTPPNNTTTFLRGDGTFATPPSSGGSTDLTADIVVHGVTVGQGPGGYGAATAYDPMPMPGTNTIFGTGAAAANTDGNGNTFVGYIAGAANTIGVRNNGVGAYVLYQNVSGLRNAALGNFALSDLISGSNNAAFGGNSLGKATGSWNVGVGTFAGDSCTTGVRNTFLGGMAGHPMTGVEWSYLAAPGGASTGDDNVLIGHATTVAAGSDSNAIVIGSNAAGLGSNTTVIGNSGTSRARVYGSLEHGDGTPVREAQMLGNALVKGISFNSNVIAEDILIPANTNAYSFGPMELSNAVVDFGDNSTWTLI